MRGIVLLAMVACGCQRLTVVPSVPAAELPEAIKQAVRDAIVAEGETQRHEWLAWEWHCLTAADLERHGRLPDSQEGDCFIRVVFRAVDVEDGQVRTQDRITAARREHGTWQAGPGLPNPHGERWRDHLWPR